MLVLLLPFPGHTFIATESFSPPALPLPAPKNYHTFADAGHRLLIFGDTYALATATRDCCALALCRLQKWNRHPCIGVSIGSASPHMASESRWTFFTAFFTVLHA